VSREAEFIRAHASVGVAPLVPEIPLYMATEVTPLWHATEAWLAARDVPPPFWAFAWSGGQAIARYLLDAPHAVRGARVLDFASGSGLVAIAAAKAGAARVIAVDVDPFAEAAIGLNAALSKVDVEARSRDLVGAPLPDVDVVTAGDVFYDRAAAARFEPWLRALAREGTRVLVGDPGRAYLPAHGLRALAAYDVATPIDLEGATTRHARVFQVLP
jgi:predicted nicotinamide N-methyase